MTPNEFVIRWSGLESVDMPRPWSAVIRDVAQDQRFTLHGVSPVPNPVPNRGIRGEWRGQEFNVTQ